MKKFLIQTSQHLEPPVLENKRRKLQIEPHEMYIESTFSSVGKDIAALYFNFLPIQGPFVITPCMDCPNKEAQFEMTIFSNHDLELERLDDRKNTALIGKWE
jgi:calpain